MYLLKAESGIVKVSIRDFMMILFHSLRDILYLIPVPRLLLMIPDGRKCILMIYDLK